MREFQSANPRPKLASLSPAGHNYCSNTQKLLALLCDNLSVYAGHEEQCCNVDTSRAVGSRLGVEF